MITELIKDYVIADAVRFVPEPGGLAPRKMAADAVRFVSNDAEAPLYVHADHLGTPQTMTDQATAPVWDRVQRPFGETVSLSGPASNPQRFPGQLHGPETGVHYNYFRDYDPTIGRYIQSDPIGLGGGVNTYGYVGGNPISLADLLGLDATDWTNTSGGRSMWDGPTNGNWGGKCWSGGQYSCGPGRGPGNAPPTDSGDQCYQRHDTCYVSCGSDSQCIARCDQQLVEDLEDLPTNPKDWPQPPRSGTEGDSGD